LSLKGDGCIDSAQPLSVYLNMHRCQAEKHTPKSTTTHKAGGMMKTPERDDADS